MSENTHEEAHTGPVKTPKQLFWVSVGAFVIPVFVIIGLVYFVTSGNKQAPGATDVARGIAERLQKVGTVEVRDANRPLEEGATVYKTQCAACHAAGVSGAPKFGDAAAWGPRIALGFDTLVHDALKGKNAMPPQGGGNFNDTEIARAVAYMANAGGAKFTNRLRLLLAPATPLRPRVMPPLQQQRPPLPPRRHLRRLRLLLPKPLLSQLPRRLQPWPLPILAWARRCTRKAACCAMAPAWPVRPNLATRPPGRPISPPASTPCSRLRSAAKAPCRRAAPLPPPTMSCVPPSPTWSTPPSKLFAAYREKPPIRRLFFLVILATSALCNSAASYYLNSIHVLHKR